MYRNWDDIQDLEVGILPFFDSKINACRSSIQIVATADRVDDVRSRLLDADANDAGESNYGNIIVSFPIYLYPQKP